MKLSGLTTNMEKSYMSPTEAKPLLGALWKPNLIIQKQENLQKLQSDWDAWKQSRTLHALRKFKGKLASLANFPGPTAQLSSAIQNNASEQEIEALLKKITTTAPSDWSTVKKALLYVDASDGGYGAVLETPSGKLIKTLAARNRLHLPIYELEWVSVWKGVTKLHNAIKKFSIKDLLILSDNKTVVSAFQDQKTPLTPTSEYYKTKISDFLAKEKMNFEVKYINTKDNKADSYSRQKLQTPKST
eukprot:GHVP01032061.1.p1 GENE.GHVP01032061.1~~GHVP01032061.1.p1  ORF type:complete len:245 (+),score=39.52 GHVP01032061.1:247-981(+)